MYLFYYIYKVWFEGPAEGLTPQQLNAISFLRSYRLRNRRLQSDCHPRSLPFCCRRSFRCPRTSRYGFR